MVTRDAPGYAGHLKIYEICLLFYLHLGWRDFLNFLPAIGSADHTESPTSTFVTFLPTSKTTPEKSLPRIPFPVPDRNIRLSQRPKPENIRK